MHRVSATGWGMRERCGRSERVIQGPSFLSSDHTLLFRMQSFEDRPLCRSIGGRPSMTTDPRSSYAT
jgi:hypothetical protein